MYGRLEKYPTKFEPVLKALIQKCLEKDENKRLGAKEMIEFQNQVEIEAYGEVRSIRLIKDIIENHQKMSSNPLVHIQAIKEIENKG